MTHAPPALAKAPGSGGPRRLLVIGCPKSGTRTFSRRLHHSGLRCDHERVGRHGSVSSYYAVDDYWYQGPHGQDRRRNYDFQETWHLIRHPLLTINSMSVGLPVAWWHWQDKHTGISMDLPPLERSSRFWLDWTNRCAKQSSYTVKLEEVETRWEEVCGKLGLEYKQLGEVHAHKRAEPLKPISWDSIKSIDSDLCDSIYQLARKYGYEE